MCGIVGTITSNFKQTKLDEWLSDALLASQVRGLHSTGLFQFKQDNKSFRTFKKATTASDFLQFKQTEEILRDANVSPCTFGHVRHATVGGKTDANAHPFVAVKDKRTVIGVHNGTLQGWRGKAGSADKDVDSAWAFHKFAEEGPIDAFEYFNGAFAFVWHDSDFPDHIFMARNDQRPLHYFQSEDNSTLLVASELGMLGWLADRNEFTLNKTQGAKPQFWYLRPDKVYKFSLKNIGEYEELDRPAYNPETTIPTPTSSALYPYTGPRSRDYYEREFMDDWDSWGSPRGRGTSDQARTLEKCKKALANARTALDDEGSEVVTADALDTRLEAGIKTAIDSFNKKQFDTWALCSERYIVNEPNTRNVTQKEMTAAHNMKMFGVAVAYVGVLYDEEVSETLGEAHVKLPFQASIGKYDCILRGLSKAAADAQYINVNTAVPVVIVGATEGLARPDETTFIVAPVSNEALKVLKDKMKAVSTSVH